VRPSRDRRLLQHTARCLAKYTLAYGKGQLEFSLPDAVRPRTIAPGSRPVLADPLAETEARLKSPLGTPLVGIPLVPRRTTRSPALPAEGVLPAGIG
jgi:hypothetical protein